MKNCVCISKEFLWQASNVLLKDELISFLKVLNVMLQHGDGKMVVVGYAEEIEDID